MPDLTISENTMTITDSSSESVSLDITTDITLVEARGIAIGLTNASGVSIEPHGIITATNLQGALEQLADQNFRTTETPTGTNVEEGDTWYDPYDNELKIYRETSSGVFQWVPIMVGSAGGDSDTLDAGAF